MVRIRSNLSILFLFRNNFCIIEQEDKDFKSTNGKLSGILHGESDKDRNGKIQNKDFNNESSFQVESRTSRVSMFSHNMMEPELKNKGLNHSNCYPEVNDESMQLPEKVDVTIQQVDNDISDISVPIRAQSTKENFTLQDSKSADIEQAKGKEL